MHLFSRNNFASCEGYKFEVMTAEGISISNSGGILALASARDLLWHGLHFGPPMYLEYIVYSQYMGGLGWEPCSKESRALASARVPPLIFMRLCIDALTFAGHFFCPSL